MNTTDQIAAFILEMLEREDGTAEFSRGAMAERFGCAPSVVTYTVQSRFTPEHGFRTEGRRSRGGCIRVTRITLNRPALIARLLDALGEELPAAAVLALTDRLATLFAEDVTELLHAAVSAPALRHVPPALRSYVRADIVRHMLGVLSAE